MHVSSEFIRLMDNRLRKVMMGEYNDLKSMIPVLFNDMTSDSAWEEFYEMNGLPDIPEFNGKLSYLQQTPGYHTKIEPKEFAGATNYEKKLLLNEKYGVFENKAKELMRAGHRTREKWAVRPWAYAFSTAFDFQTREEAVALCSDSHSTKSGASTTTGFDNAGTSALNKTSLAATRLAMRRFKDGNGERIDIGDNLAIVHPDNLSDTVAEIIGTQSGYDTAANTKNVDYQRYESIPYLRLDDYDTNNWFMVDKAKMKQNLHFINRVQPEIETTADFETKGMKTSLYMYFAYGFTGWRWIFGHNVS